MASHKMHASNLFDLSGRVACISGAGTGIGLMIAQALAANGVKVYIFGRRKEVLDKSIEVHGRDFGSSGGSIVALQGDCTSKESLTAIFDEIEKREGHLSILVNNAGINQKEGDITIDDPKALSDELFNGSTFESWSQLQTTDITSYYFTSVKALPLLVKGNEKFGKHTSSIISICSMSGETSTTQGGQFAYNSAKAATIQLVNLLAHEFSRESLSVRSVGISPGYFPSEMTTGESGEDNKSHIPTGPEWGKSSEVPGGRPGHEHDMAQLAIMLAANKYMQGEVIRIDGGRQLINA